jgi:hypothetical protein
MQVKRQQYRYFFCLGRHLRRTVTEEVNRRTEYRDLFASILSDTSSNWVSLVAPAGFEPAISALRGLRPRPLDDGATSWWAALGSNQRPLACEASALPLS